MTDLTRHFSELSYPANGAFSEISQQSRITAASYFLRNTKASLARYDRSISLPDIEIIADCWCPELGHIAHGLRQLQPSETHILDWIEAQLHLFRLRTNQLPNLKIKLQGKHPPLMFAGHLIQGSDIEISSCSQTTEIISDDARSFRKKSEYGIWLSEGENFLALNEGSFIHILDGQPANMFVADQYESYRSGNLGFTQHLQEALDVLCLLVPEYYRWCSQVLKELVPIEPPSSFKGTKSGSFMFWPGHIYMSGGASVVEICSVLTHECSHQYFNQIAAVWPLTVEPAPKIYSVLKNTLRPLSMILTGFHAFGNVLLMLNRLRQNIDAKHLKDLDDDYRRTSEIVRSLDAGIVNHGFSYLSTAGKSFYLPLRNKLEKENILEMQSIVKSSVDKGST